MRQEVIIASLHRRVRQRTNLVLVVLVGCVFSISRLFVDARTPVSIVELALPFVLLFIHLALTPIPWQWTGDDAERAGMLRGFLQALVFNALWAGLLMGLMPIIAGPRPPGPPLVAPGPPLPMPPMGPHPKPRPFFPAFGLAVFNTALGIVFGWVFAEKEATEAKERRTAGLLRQSEARALQGQLDPHVLYNALSSLSELVYEDPLAAEEAITRLADLYRMLTVHGKADRIPLGQERMLVEAYLAMEQMRLGDRLRVRWDWPEGADTILAPPLFLQPLVENAIKHGISPSDKGGVLIISCARHPGGVSIAVENTGRPLREDAPRGIGLGNLEARLALWTEAKGVFSLSSRNGWTVARVEWTTGADA